MGETYFTNAFKEAKTIIDNINRNEHIPVIILLTDGMTIDSKDVMNYLQNDVSLIYNINNFIYL